MKTWFQRIRAAIGIGATWAAGWAPLGAITGWITGTLLGLPLRVVTYNYAVTFGLLGLIGGTIFSSVLSIAERHRSFNRLSLTRFLVWGATGGLVLGGLAVTAGLFGAGRTTLGAVIMAVSTVLGASSAAGTLALARVARDQPLVDGQAVPEPDLTGRIRGERLGTRK